MTPIFGMGGEKLGKDGDGNEQGPELPPIRSFAVQLAEKDSKGRPLSVVVRAHSYDIPNGALVFAEYIDVGGGKAAIVVADAFAPGVWTRWREVPANVVENTSETAH